MQFKKLKIRGFKGFADPIELPIRDGLSGIVGPNGCGKSNLVEAFGWVMGENRPTVLRGGSMEDVIFSGAATRPASSLAEVELEIDDPEGRISSGPGNDGQINVTRRVERDGGSTFLVNGKDVRWRDIQLLFADSASGARSSALVRQGQISEIINARPSSRSGILEDAAGIGGLFQRRHEAELKLNATSQNLSRLDDIIEQLKGHIQTVTRQARQAARYRKLGEQLRKAEALLQHVAWQQADQELMTADGRARTTTSETARLFKDVSAAESRKSELDASLSPLREAAAAAHAAVQRLKAESELIGEKQAGAERALQALQGQIAQIGEDSERERTLETEAADRVSQLENLQLELAQGSEGFEEKREEAERRLAAARTSLEALEAELDASNRILADMLSKRDAAERTRMQADGALESWRQREEKARSAVAEGEARLAEAAILAKTADGMRARAEREAEDAESAIVESETAVNAVQAELASARESLSRVEGRLATLTAEKSELSKLLNGDDTGKARILDRITVRRGYEAAFGAALGDDLFAPELNGVDESGWRPLEPYSSEQPLPPGMSPLSEFVTAPGLLARRMGQTGLLTEGEIDDVQPLLKPGQRVVTRGGDLCRWDGFKVVGSETPTSASLRLKQRNRLEEVNSALVEVGDEFRKARSERDRLTSLDGDLSRADELARMARRAAEQALTEAGRELSVAEADTSIAERTLDSLRQACSRIRDESSAAEQAVREAEKTLESLEDVDAATVENERIKQAVSVARNNMVEVRSRKVELEREHSSRMARIASLPDEIENWKSRHLSAGQRIAALQDRAESCQDELSGAAVLPEQLRLRQAELAEEIASADERRRDADTGLHETESTARKTDAEVRELNRQASQSLEAKGRAEADAENARTRLSEIRERILERLGCQAEELAEQFELDVAHLPSLEEQEAEVARLRRSRDALGAVNLRAEQDIAELEAEMAELDGERRDLQEAVANLRATIATLNRDGRSRLLSAFDQVNRNFEMIFQHLFGGGRARLELVEGDDPLDTGLEILCRPPGKRFSNISLLSGGEQTLTALALIFAFFLANPAPVCVLDEVDAPLDDTNVMKFCRLVDEMSRRTGTRFLIVTHHTITMSRMDRLFGVTMQEKGVSQLVSVDLGQAERMAA